MASPKVEPRFRVCSTPRQEPNSEAPQNEPLAGQVETLAGQVETLAGQIETLVTQTDILARYVDRRA